MERPSVWKNGRWDRSLGACRLLHQGLRRLGKAAIVCFGRERYTALPRLILTLGVWDNGYQGSLCVASNAPDSQVPVFVPYIDVLAIDGVLKPFASASTVAVTLLQCIEDCCGNVQMVKLVLTLAGWPVDLTHAGSLRPVPLFLQEEILVAIHGSS